MGETPKDDLYSLWQGLLYGGGGMRFLRIILTIFLVISIGWSIYLYKRIVFIAHLPYMEVSLAQPVIGQDQKYENLVEGFEKIVHVRSIKIGMTNLASKLDRYAFNEPAIHRMQAALREVDGQREKTISSVVEQVSLPPYMEVRGIMILDKRPMAVMDIEGEGNGVIVSPGYKFRGGKGRVVDITQTMVMILWAGRHMELALDTLR